MKPKQNWYIWSGFVVVLVGLLTYIPIFLRFPLTRDFPWVNLLLLAAGLTLLVAGLVRAFASDRRYRGQISGPIVTVLSVALTAFFCWGLFIAARQLPPPAGALHAGQTAPDFTLTDADGNAVRLSAMLRGNRAVLLIFYRGYW